MRIQIIHLSDMHFANKSQIFSIDVDKMITAIRSTEQADEYIIVVSGDLVNTGKKEEYQLTGSFLGAVLKRANYALSGGKRIEVLCVPGNHDIDFSDLDISFSDIFEAYKTNNLIAIQNNYLNNLEAFFSFAQARGCFKDNHIISKRVISYGEKRIGFVMLNTAPLSLLGGSQEDMGQHYISESDLNILEQATDSNINILIMHHSMEWFCSETKNKLREILFAKYSLVLSGHEHKPVGESRNYNKKGELQIIQGNALYNSNIADNGFCTISLSLEDAKMTGYSYVWKNNIFVPTQIIDSDIKFCYGGDLIVKQDFIHNIDFDTNKRRIDSYYVFPGISYSIYEDGKDFEQRNIDNERELYDLINQNCKIIITGDAKSGKSLLAQRLFKEFLRNGKFPLLMSLSEIDHKKFERAIMNTFAEQYDVENYAYEKYCQLGVSDKVIILDDTDLLKERSLASLLPYLESRFGTVILFSEEQINLDVKKQVLDIIGNDRVLHLKIQPFLYSKRKELIENVLSNSMDKDYDIGVETNKINNLINSQIKYFPLDPEFIINFVSQYEQTYRYDFSSGKNIFNIVYESSVKNKIIFNAQNIHPTDVISLLRDLAFDMHFGKKKYFNTSKIADIVNKYNLSYRQNVSTKLFLSTALKAKILIENGDEYRFRDRTLLAYFVAIAINFKFNHGEEINEYTEDLLHNLCFGINSDIILFLALITDNPIFINIILTGAENHFRGQEELSFDKSNIEFLTASSLPVNQSIPSEQERRQREKIIEKQEENVRMSDLIELTNEYDYTDEDVKKDYNQELISLKYLEILSKTLPAFCQSLKVDMQDELVRGIYQYPNKFLFSLLDDIADDFDEICDELYEQVSELRKEKDIVGINLESVKHFITQISLSLIVSTYQLVAETCASEQSIGALNAFEINQNLNYKLQNLMMESYMHNVSTFSKKAKALDKEAKNKLEKSMIRYIVRNYLLRNTFELHGEAQSLIDYFFEGKSNNELKMNIVKKQIEKNDLD